MAAYKCERCGALYETKTIPNITINEYHHGYGEVRLNICHNCQKQLEKWLKNDT